MAFLLQIHGQEIVFKTQRRTLCTGNPTRIRSIHECRYGREPGSHKGRKEERNRNGGYSWKQHNHGGSAGADIMLFLNHFCVSHKNKAIV